MSEINVVRVAIVFSGTLVFCTEYLLRTSELQVKSLDFVS